ncbi:nardilysin-like isoform X2 [Varroa jacobsoni]|uniref:nardilysin-like isoform X2 n=1 Tax=Varroa jacobsoni TaxID=62625 RepID=UPI000BF9F9B9|nr:nardilysin-like isoform X2 [Varroa jacobsoni]
MPLIKSENDKRFYRLIELTNGLKAMLVSSAPQPVDNASRRLGVDLSVKRVGKQYVKASGKFECNKSICSSTYDEIRCRTEKMAAAALVVKAGSFQDPPHIAGLAHFLDHMLLLGSEKYPKEGEYLQFICKNGGSINATTAVDMTMFRFDTSQAAFPTALDMFANFFIKPLFREDAIDREVCAVESEFQLEQVSDIRRAKEVLARLAGDDHPMGRFVWGNISTLKDGPREKGLNIRNELINFYNNYYSADVMTLCVQSKHTLDELEQFVRASFSPVPRQKRTPIEYPKELPLKDNQNFCKLFKILPVNRILTAILSWVIPSQSSRYMSRSLDYLLYVVGHGGHNGILDHLRRRNWAFDLATGPVLDGFDHNVMCAIFTINITLTEKGASNLGEVLRLVHQYLHMLRKKGPQWWLWEELQYMAQIDFRYQGEEDPADYVCRVSKSMQIFREDHFLCGDDLYFEYDPSNIQDLMNQLTPDCCNTIFLNHNFHKDSDQFVHREPCMGAIYKIEDYPEEWTKLWNDDPSFQKQFNVPEPNQYRPTDLSIKQEASYGSEPYPVVILDRPRARLWYRKDQKFFVPRAFVNLHLITMLPYMSIEGAICVEIMTHALVQRLGPINNYAEMASLLSDVNGFNWGTTICVGGFNHKLPVLLENVLDALIRFDFSDDLFHMIKLKLGKLYHNKVLTNSRYGYEVCAAVIHRSTTVDKRREALRSITKYDVIDNTRRLCATAFVEAYVHGNLTSTEARDLISRVEMKFSASPLDRRMNQHSPVISGETYVRCLGINPEDKSSRIVNYYIYGPAHFYEETMMQILVKLMEPHCIIQLRTKQQFGYDACCSMYNCGGVIGFIVSVSPAAYKFTLSYVDEKIDDYIDSMIRMITELGQAEFNMVRDALIKAKQRTDLSIAGEQRRHWERIVQFDYMFEQNQFEVKFLRTLDLNRFRRWALRVLPARGRDRRKLSVQIVGHGQVALEECVGGEDIWKELQQKDVKKYNLDIDQPIPPMRMLAPKTGGRKLYVRDFEAYVNHCEYYPPAKRDPRARMDF